MIESENKVEVSAPASDGAEASEKKPARRRTKKAEAAPVEPKVEEASEVVEAPKPRRTRTKKASAEVSVAAEVSEAAIAASAEASPVADSAPKPRRARAKKETTAVERVVDSALIAAPSESAAVVEHSQVSDSAGESSGEFEEGSGKRTRRSRSRVKKADAPDQAATAEASSLEGVSAPADHSVVDAEKVGDHAEFAQGDSEQGAAKAEPGERREKAYSKKDRRDRNRDKRDEGQGKGAQSSQRQGDGRQAGGKQNAQKQNGRDERRRNRRERNQVNREVVPSVTREELSEMKVADLRAKATDLSLDVSGLKKAELVEAVFEASMKAEGFIEVSGVLDIMPDGYGFLRATGYLPGEGDAYVGAALVRRNGLRKGDFVVGQTRPARENEKFAAIQKVISVNGVSIAELGQRPRFADLTPVYPDERLHMEHGRSTITARVIDLCAPIGKGQRGLIVSPPKAGKTTVLKDIAASITANNPEVHLMCLLVDERPEEVTDMERSIKGEVVSSTFDMPSENHIAVAELVIERAKRLVEMGRDVVILLDSITRLARAYNLAQPASGRILSGGVDSTALYPPKRFLGAARNIEGGGSLTILASALIDTGSKMDEVIFEEFKGTGNMELKLDRYLADRRIFPAIDPVTSGTRKEDLLLNPQEAPLIWAVRRILANLNNTERAMEMLIKSLKQTETNQEFLIRTAKKAQTQVGKADENLEL